MINIKRVKGCELPLPKRESDGAAGYDLRSNFDNVVSLPPGERKLIETGFKWEIPPGMVGLIQPRSGLACREGLDTMAGVIDSDYRGEVGVLLINHGHQMINIEPGDRIAQMVVTYYRADELVEVDNLSDSSRGTGGFGSTGVNY